MSNVSHCTSSLYHTRQTPSCLVPPVSSHVVDSHPGRLSPRPAVQRFFLFHKCLRTYPEPGRRHFITHKHTLNRAHFKTPPKKPTHLSLDKFIPIVVWERAVEQKGQQFMNSIEKQILLLLDVNFL